ncbi:MAG: GTPase HflX [candidate division WOR-3 bacterium]
MERVLLIAVAKTNKERWHKIDALEELASLTETAGGQVVERILQIKENFDPATLIAKGKLNEIKYLCHKHHIDLLIFENQLTATQIRNISEIVGVRIIDRTALILDIFAQHAKTAEAKAQVELAQLEYRLSNLIGYGNQLSRLGGGIGTRGPGERKLEIDRRHIRQRITILRKTLAKIDKERAVQRKNRQSFFKIALTGYTNAGKSTLMNSLTDANVKVAPYLFATLDANTKSLSLSKNIKVFITDTVGFIRNLPYELIASFRSTLSEIKNADLILHIIDTTDRNINEKIEAVNSTLCEIECDNKPILLVFNKIDQIFEVEIIKRLKRQYPKAVFISAQSGEGIENLKQVIMNFVKSSLTIKTFSIPQNRGDLINIIYENCEVIKRVENNSAITLKVRGYKTVLNKLAKLY